MTILQIFTLSAANMRSIPGRWQSSVVLVIAIAGVTSVLLGLLVLVDGLADTIRGTSRPDRAIVVSRSAQSEVVSSLTRDAAAVIETAPEIRLVAGKSAVVKEVVMSITVPQGSQRVLGEITLRGTSRSVLVVRPETRITAGRMFEPGAKEVLVGGLAQSLIADGHTIGSLIAFGGDQWRVVGFFETGGDLHESEIWADSETVLSAFRKNDFQSVTVLLASDTSAGAFKQFLKNYGSLGVDGASEDEYFRAQSSRLNALLGGVASTAGTLMGLGAVLAVLHAMMSALVSRYREIGTLYALGFRPLPVIVAMLVEAISLSLMGALIGIVVTLLLLGSDSRLSTAIGSGSRVVITLNPAPHQVMTATALACTFAVLGTVLPALRASRLSVTTLLKT